MSRFRLIILPFVMALLPSCEGSTGYLDNDQENTIDKLTDVEWVLVYADYGLGNEYVYEDQTSIYRFDRTGKGWFGLGSVTDPTFKENIRYFQWTFTTSNFTVIQTAGNASDGFWLIKKLTSEELWVQWTTHDPVYYPNQTVTFKKYKARRNDN